MPLKKRTFSSMLFMSQRRLQLILCRKLDKLLDEFPANVCKYKILPHLITALDFGSGSFGTNILSVTYTKFLTANPKVLGPLLKIGGHLTAEEYAQKVTPNVVKWFGSNDRALRINLLENLESFANHLTPSLINDQIFPNVVCMLRGNAGANSHMAISVLG